MVLCRAIPIVFLLAGIAGTASAATYDCAFKANKKKSVVAPTIRLSVDEGAGTATAYDSFIQAKHGGPIAARFTRRNAGSVQFDWEVEVPFSRNRTSQADYQVILDEGRLTAKIRVHVPGDFDPTTGKGTCRRSP